MPPNGENKEWTEWLREIKQTVNERKRTEVHNGISDYGKEEKIKSNKLRRSFYYLTVIFS